jgi:hypothetical protein
VDACIDDLMYCGMYDRHILRPSCTAVKERMNWTQGQTRKILICSGLAMPGSAVFGVYDTLAVVRSMRNLCYYLGQ